MKKTNHNNGPLAALRYHVTGAIERGEGQAVVGLTKENLVAAGPEMLAALERFAKWAERNNDPGLQGITCDAFAAIAKAKG